MDRLIDLSQPLAVLFMSVVHSLIDADNPRRVLRTIIDQAMPGSYMALSQVVSDDEEKGAALTEFISSRGVS